MSRLPLLTDDGKVAEAGFRATLHAICADADTHVRFLNTLSLLEYIGSRKIMTARGRVPDGAMLKHLAEESRHAFFFKRAAEKLARRDLDYAGPVTLAGPAARFYMGRLDARISDALPGDKEPLPYLYMSLTIEIRAIWAYRIYHDVLAELRCGISLTGLLAEENLHLDQMQAAIIARDERAAERIPAFAAVETREFVRLWRAIETAASSARMAAA